MATDKVDGKDDSPSPSSGAPFTEEEKAIGTVALGVYKSYWKAIGGCLATVILLSVVAMQSECLMSTWTIFQLSLLMI